MRATRRVCATLVLTVLALAPTAQHAQQGQVDGQVIGLPQAPPRDQPPTRTGTAAIAGIIG